MTGGSGAGDRASNTPCVICDATASAILECDAQIILIRMGAGLALAPRCHIGRWRDLMALEQTALAGRIGPAQALLETADVRARVTLVETNGHVHLRFDPPLAAPGPLPGMPHDAPTTVKWDLVEPVPKELSNLYGVTD